MMIGCDVVDIERFENMDSKFLSKVFTDSEIAYLERKKYRGESIAGLYAAKEAVLKALGIGIAGGFKNVEIFHAESGQPQVRLLGELQNEFSGHCVISISHSRNVAMAMAIYN